MKKTVLLLAVCLMLGLCACGLRGQSVARNTVEPVHFSAALGKFGKSLN